jgi:hypothetical protein
MIWTRDRVAALKTADIRQLRINADKLHERDVVALCDEVLATRPKINSGPRGKRQREPERARHTRR